MVKNYVLIIFFILTEYSFGFSQSDFKVSTPYPSVYGTPYYFSRDNSILAVKISPSEVNIQKFNIQSQAQICQEKYNDFSEFTQFEYVVEYNKRYFIIYSLWDKQNQYEQLFYREIDFASGKFINTGTLIFRIEGKVAGNAPYQFNWTFGLYVTFNSNFQTTNKFLFSISADSKKLLIGYKRPSKEKRDKLNYDIYGYCLLDENLKIEWDKEIEMPYSEAALEIWDNAIDINGNVNILSAVYENGAKKGSDLFRIELLKLKKNTDNFEITKIDTKSKIIFSMFLTCNEKGQTWCFAFYRDNYSDIGHKGLLTAKIIENEISNTSIYEFPKEILNQYKNTDETDYIEDAEINNIEFNEDESITLFGGQSFYLTETYVTYGMARTKNTFYFSDILVMKINPENKLKWMARLPKSQKVIYSNSAMPSYRVIQGENKYWVIFIDHPKNKDIAFDKEPKSLKGLIGVLSAFRLDKESGNYDKIQIFDSKNIDGIKKVKLNFGKLIETNKREFVTEIFTNENTQALLKVNFNK